MESFYFMPFRTIIHGKSKLPAYHTAEKQDNPRQVKTSCKLSCGKFQYTAESQNLTFERLITISADNLDNKSTMAYQYYLRFKRKN
jgi:hypothetical protein